MAVARLKQAGAVILGKTNLATAIGDWQSYNVIYDVTNNPWDVARTAGGSAAALATGYVPLELGSDIFSSLRMPAHVCGVFSHKPSSDSGAVARPFAAALAGIAKRSDQRSRRRRKTAPGWADTSNHFGFSAFRVS